MFESVFSQQLNKGDVGRRTRGEQRGPRGSDRSGRTNTLVQLAASDGDVPQDHRTEHGSADECADRRDQGPNRREDGREAREIGVLSLSSMHRPE